MTERGQFRMAFDSETGGSTHAPSRRCAEPSPSHRAGGPRRIDSIMSIICLARYSAHATVTNELVAQIESGRERHVIEPAGPHAEL